MRKYVLLLILILCAAILCACASKSSEATSEPQTVATEDSTEITNPFLKMKYVDHPTEGGGICRVYYMPKDDAIACSADDYEEFIQTCVSLHKGFIEYITLSFGDGTGVIYYGSDPSNSVYGPYGEKCFVAPDTAYGYIVPNGDGTYEYHEYTD